MMKIPLFRCSFKITHWLFAFVIVQLTCVENYAQTVQSSTRDSIANNINIAVLKKQLLIAGDLYKIRKYKLDSRYDLNPDTLLQQSLSNYQALFTALPKATCALYFTNDFYKEVIPVVQYFRHAYFASLLMQHQEQLHPIPKVNDPKHHDQTHHNHID